MTISTTDQFIIDAGLAHEIIQGDANTTVTTAGGPVRSLAKLISDNQADLDLIASQSVVDYAALRAYAGSAKYLYVSGYFVTASPSGIVGNFVRDDHDTSSVDNGGTVIVTGAGKRYKRAFYGSVNVQWFGAIGDWNGVTGSDDTAAIQAALDAANSTYIPKTANTYKISNLLNLPQNVTLLSNGAEIKRTHAYTVATAMIQAGYGGNVIRGLIFNGNASTFGGDIAVSGGDYVNYIDFLTYNSAAVGETKIVIEGCTFKNSCGSFIGGNGKNVTIRGNNFGDYRDHSVYFARTAANNYTSTDILVRDNIFYAANAGSTREAVKCRNGVDRWSIINNHFYLPYGVFCTVDSGDASGGNYDSTGIKISGNIGECVTFGKSQTGNQSGAASTWGVLRDVEMCGNHVICTGGYALNFDSANNNDPTWKGGVIDELKINDNWFLGKSLISIGGVKNRNDGYSGIKLLAITDNVFAPNPKTQAFNTGQQFYLTGDIGQINIKRNVWLCDSNLGTALIKHDFGTATTVATWQSDVTRPGPAKTRTWSVSENTFAGYVSVFYDTGGPTTDASVFSSLDTFGIGRNLWKFPYASQPYIVNASALTNSANWLIGSNSVAESTFKQINKSQFSGASFSGAFIQFSSADYLIGQATYDPPSLADGAGITTTVTLTGAALGDFVEASFSADISGITVTAWISAANTASVRFQNESGGTVDLASGTLRVRSFK